jgi:SAM-dependent methyltransferase
MNQAERERWNDATWTALWPKRERLTDPVLPILLAAAAPQPGERVLDVGYGGGRTSLAAAKAVGASGSVVGADFSEPLSRLASRRAAEAGVDNVSFHVADMQAEIVAGGPFDVVMSQFGVMFFEEPQAAFANIRAHMRAGGRLAFACWQAVERNPWFFAPAIAGLLPPPPAPAPGKVPPGPFALADPLRTTDILSSAGFDDIRFATHELTVEVPQDTIVDEAQLGFMGVPLERRAEAQAAVEDYMRRFVLSADRSRFPLAFQVFEASNAPT